MGFFWWLDAILGRESNEAKPSEPVNLADAFADYGKANPKQRQAAGRIHGALSQAGYETLQDLKSATDEDLLKVKGIGQYALKFIREVEGTYDDSN